MSSVKWGIAFAAAALVISTAVGIVSTVSAGHIILRALIFAVIFFGLGIGSRVLINNYFPELLSLDEADGQANRLRVDITLGNSLESDSLAVPEMYNNSKDSKELGNIEDLLSGSFRVLPEEGIDRKREGDYNDIGGELNDEFKILKPVETVRYKSSSFTPSINDSDDLGALPDLGAMAMAFSSDSEPDYSAAFGKGNESAGSPSGGILEAMEVPSFNEAEAAPQYKKRGEPKPLNGDFAPKELAEGIRTILTMEK